MDSLHLKNQYFIWFMFLDKLVNRMK